MKIYSFENVSFLEFPLKMAESEPEHCFHVLAVSFASANLLFCYNLYWLFRVDVIIIPPSILERVAFLWTVVSHTLLNTRPKEHRG